MRTTLDLPLPHLSKGRFASLDALSDEALFEGTGVRIAFTGRQGGVSTGAFAALNLSLGTGDEAEAVGQNRRILMAAFDAAGLPCIVPSQVHGDRVVAVADSGAAAVRSAAEDAQAGADAVVVEVPQVAALLCFADCVPVIAVSPSGRFAVIHAGWRGVMNGVAVKAVKALAEADGGILGSMPASRYNLYIGPHIQAGCFETGADVHRGFVEAFGQSCAPDGAHIDLACALRTSLEGAGVAPERIADAGVCTVCDNENYFSYRAQDGTCGRHGAFAVRSERA